MTSAIAGRRPYPSRIEAIRRFLKSPGGKRTPIDALLVTEKANVFYMSGFTGSLAHILITASEALLLTDGRYTAQAAEQCPQFTIIVTHGSGGCNEALAGVLAERPGLRRIGFDDAHATVAQLKSWRKGSDSTLQWVPCANAVENLRMIKDDSEIVLIREAITLAESALESMRHMIKPGVTELEFALQLDFTMRRLGADAPAFDTIVASGPNGAYPHHFPTDRAFRAGDLVTIDWGARKGGYCSDLTRTLAVPGAAVDTTLAQVHKIVLEAKQRASEACVSGALGKDVDQVARDFISDAGFGDEFKHSLGHSLGIEVHDGITLSTRADDFVLRPGTVTTVEPGVYLDGLGGVRIEEDVLISETGPIVLSKPGEAL